MANRMTDDRGNIAKATDDRFAGAALPTPIGVSAGTARHESEQERRPHSGKFLAVRVTLIGLAIAALALAGVIALSPKSHNATSVPWSTWSPPDSGLQGAQDIADYIAPYYRATPSAQLAVVTAINLNSSSNPLQVAIPATTPTTTTQSGSNGSAISLEPLPARSTVVYNLCGTGSGNCSIGVGQPSSARLLLLRREALELALYTFKYIGGTQTVVAILPPGHTQQGCTGICPKPQATTTTKPVNLAVAFDRQELSQLLAVPLRATLPEYLPPSVAAMPSAREAELVSVITARGMFSEHVEQSQSGSQLVVLSPMSPQ